MYESPVSMNSALPRRSGNSSTGGTVAGGALTMLVAFFVFWITSTAAAPIDYDDVAAEFQKLDKDGDSRLTLDEYRLSKRTEESFRKLDKDGDAALTLEEFLARK